MKNEAFHPEKPAYKIGNGILTAYFIMMAVVYPLYAPGGYLRIGEVKYYFFRNVSLAALAALCGTVAAAALCSRDRAWIVNRYRGMSATDWCAYGYGLAVLLSYLFSPYKEDALWGVEGWYMGVVSQAIFVLLYFFFSRFTGAAAGKWLYLWLSASSVVFALGICNRYSLYPVAMEGRTETFISTLGNINWFCGYWSVTAPVGMTLYWCGAKGLARILLGLYSLTAMLSGITQGSSSAYLVFPAMLVLLSVLSLGDRDRRNRLLELCILFAAACQVGRILQYLPGLSYNYQDLAAEEGGITGWLLHSNAVTGGFLLLSGLWLLLRLLDRKRLFRGKGYGGPRNVPAAVMVSMAAAAAAVLLLLWRNDTVVFREDPPRVILDEDWGNGRGATWNCGVDAYRSMDVLHKIVGIGPDCFADYIYDVPELGDRMADRFGNLRLTNTHNEWLTLLVNTGALGLLCYVGMLGTAFVRYLDRVGRQPLLYVCAAALLAYTVHNMVSFQQVLNTPFLFIVLGIGESLGRTLERHGGAGSEGAGSRYGQKGTTG